MMKKLAVLASVVAAIAVARPALAQGPFADVPTDHWAYDAVNELAKQGIVNGYPDSTFGGKRALTRYEFAMAIQRMLQEVQRRIDAKGGTAQPAPTDLSNYYTKTEIDEKLRNVPTREEVDRLRSDVDQLRRLATEFQDTLAALGTDVDQLKRDLAALRDRLTALENEVHRMPKITGNAMLGFYGSYLTEASLNRQNAAPAGSGRATDIDNRSITSDNVLQNAKSIYDIDLGITARLSDVATARLLLNAGNYIGGYLNNSLSTVRDFGSNTFENVRPYYLYLETPVSAGSLGASLTVVSSGSSSRRTP
jgi:polyhydroxyalkanoate synthesis regulator phasin